MFPASRAGGKGKAEETRGAPADIQNYAQDKAGDRVYSEAPKDKCPVNKLNRIHLLKQL